MSNDLISRSELKKAVTKWFIDERYYNPLDKPENMTESMLLSFINNAPAIKPERPQGEWIEVHYAREELNCPEKSMLDFVKCPFCETIHQGRHNFCSRCGADMRGDENEQ